MVGLPALAYLPSDLRAQVRDDLDEQGSPLVQRPTRVRRLEAEWQGGLINGLEYQTKQAYEAALQELGQ